MDERRDEVDEETGRARQSEMRKGIENGKVREKGVKEDRSGKGVG